MGAFFAIVALGLVFLTSFVLFANELYYRRRVSACGLICFFCSIYLMFYLHDINETIIGYAVELSKFEEVPTTSLIK